MTRLYLQHRPRIILVNILVASLLLAVVAKLFYVQILKHELYSSQAEHQGTELQPLPAVPGNIFDRNGVALTANLIHYSFAVDPGVVEDPESIIKVFARTFRRPEMHYRQRMASDRSFVWLERNVPRARCETLLDFQARGLIVRREVRRRYPYGSLVAPLVGFTNVDGKGIAGLELEYDTFLRGANGWQVLKRNARGRVLPHFRSEGRVPLDGARVKLTLDLDYHSILQEEMARAYERLEPRSIQGILMVPGTGEILAIAQLPSFDPNEPGSGSGAGMRLLAVTDMYEPGSTLKVVTAAAALDQGLHSPGTEFYCEDGEFVYQNLRIRDSSPRGILTFAEVLAHSSNIGIIKIAESLGASRLYSYCRRFGLGTRTGITLSGESAGLLRAPREWTAVSTGEIAMGQEIGVTTLQLALAYSAIANGGLLMRPFIVSEIRSPQGQLLQSAQPEVIRRVASQTAMKQLRAMLHLAVEQGTGTAARLPGYSLAGKTGTAQKFLNGKYSEKEFVATFAAIFPSERPRLVCVVAVDGPLYGSHFGGEAAAPIVSNSIRRILNLDDNFYAPPQVVVAVADDRSSPRYLLATAGQLRPAARRGVVPDFKGYSLRKALQLARQAGVRLRVEGSGGVVRQSAKPGSILDPDEECMITLAHEGYIR